MPNRPAMRGAVRASGMRPSTAPPPATPTQTPTARPRSSGGKVVVMIDNVTGMTAAPMPITARSAIRGCGEDTNIAEGIGSDDADYRAALLMSQIVEVERPASRDHLAVADAIAPTLQRYLTGDLSAQLP